MSTKALFEQPVQKLREALNTIDECTEHGHYSRPLNVLNSKGETLYYELAGHPLPCTSDCQSSLRVLRAAATHFPQLRRLVCLLYDAIRQHRLLESIDTALCSDIWIKLKTHVSQSNSEANSQTHYVCQYCRSFLNKNNMSCRCILNGLITEPVPKEPQVLDPLSKQLIQRGKAF